MTDYSEILHLPAVLTGQLVFYLIFRFLIGEPGNETRISRWSAV
jgi:hypothetical protein